MTFSLKQGQKLEHVYQLSQPAKLDLNKKSLPKQKTIQNIFCFSEPLGIKSEVLNRLLLGQGLFI